MSLLLIIELAFAMSLFVLYPHAWNAVVDKKARAA